MAKAGASHTPIVNRAHAVLSTATIANQPRAALEDRAVLPTPTYNSGSVLPFSQHISFDDWRNAILSSLNHTETRHDPSGQVAECDQLAGSVCVSFHSQPDSPEAQRNHD